MSTHTCTHTQRADCSMFVSAPRTLSPSILEAPRRHAPSSPPCITPRTCLAVGGEPQICHEREKRAPQVTVAPAQYFMKMKCCGSVYGGQGVPERRGASGCKDQFQRFIPNTFYKEVRGGRGPPGLRVTLRTKQEIITFKHDPPPFPGMSLLSKSFLMSPNLYIPTLS